MRIAIVGTARRSDYLYGPIIKAIPGLELVSVWGRSDASAKALGESLGVPHFTDLAKLKRETAPELAVVSVAYSANGEVGLMAVENGLHVLLETPIAHKLKEADAIMELAKARGLKIEIAEQFFRRPLEQIKLKLIESGLFGQVYSSFNDFAGHGYHGVSVMRSYLGFDKKPIRVTGAVKDYDLAAHYSRIKDAYEPRQETQEHGMIEFEGGELGIFHWTSVGYDSPLRWWRSSRFLAEKGMGVTTGFYPDLQEQLSVLAPGGEGYSLIRLERRFERNDGGALVEMVAHTGNPELPIVSWQNPFKPAKKGHGIQWHDDEIAVASCLMSLVDAVRTNSEPSYGAAQGRLDQEIILAIRQSSAAGGEPITLPLNPEAQTL